MKSIETKTTDTTYGGVPDRNIDDLPTETSIEILADGTIVKAHRSYWVLSDEEKTAVLLGAQITIDVLGDSVPPIRPGLTEPPDQDAETVLRSVDAILKLSVAYSVASAMAAAGIVRSPMVVASWSDDEQKEVGLFLRGIGEGRVGDVPPVLELSEDELAAVGRSWPLVESDR